MLVLSRKKGEAFVIPALGITVYVAKIVGHRVTLSIEAPRDVRIVRGELDRFEPEPEPEEVTP